MNRKAFQTFSATLAAGLGLLGGARLAAAQTPPFQNPPSTTTVAFPGDWPNLGAYSNRQGQNGNPYDFTSGVTRLRYLTPNTLESREPVVLDNTDLQAFEFSTHTTTPVYDDPLYSAYSTGGQVLSYVAFTGVQNSAQPLADWRAPSDANAAVNTTNFASNPYVPYTRVRNINATYPYDGTPRVPAYQYATCVPCARNQADPTVTKTGITPKVFTWSFAPLAGTQRTYALYAQLPVGPTNIPFDPGDPGSAPVTTYTQPYYVFEIRWGSTLAADGLPINRLVDIRSVNSSNQVRLGITGQEDATVFPSDGSRIVVRLYNTVPRYDQIYKRVTGAAENTDRLILPNSTVGDTDTVESTESLAHLVYADAISIRPESGTYSAGPAAATLIGNALPTTPTFLEDTTADWDVTVARNELVTGFRNGAYFTANQGLVVNYQANPQRWLAPSSPTSTMPYEKWRYSVLDTTGATTTVDNGTSHTAGFTAQTVNPYHIGTDYLRSAVSAFTNSFTETVSYAPALDDGDYSIYAYIPGNQGAEAYGHNVLYQIREGTVITNVYVDQTITRGWVRLGTRRFTHTSPETTDLPLTVTVTNLSTLSAPGVTPVVAEDPSTKIYADAIRFVSTTNGGVTSTPVHATIALTPQGGGTPQPKKVVIVADEAGKIHCLDEQGRNDGTTTEYWSYPSTPDLTDDTWIDPNLNGAATSLDPDHDPLSSDLTTAVAPGPDGAYNKRTVPFRDNLPTAVMPTGYDLSTAVVVHVPDPATPNDITTGRDLLYIGATNGRVYCIDCSGRGDYDVTTRKVGTARRQWSFPSDYPSAQVASSLKAFRGSILFGDATQGCDGPTVFVPAAEGRVYALDAFGSPIINGTASGTTTTAATGGVTTTKWAFPNTNHVPVPLVQMTPTLIRPTGTNTVGRLLFGTQGNANDDTSGQFYCLNAQTGDAFWDVNGEVFDPTGTLGVDAHIIGPGDAQGRPATIRQTDATLSTITYIDQYTALPVTYVDSFGNFTTGVVALNAATLNQVPASVSTTTPVAPNFSTDKTPTASVDTVYTLNDNGILYGLRLADGGLVVGNDGVHALRTYTGALSNGSLDYTVITDNGRNGPLERFPEIVVPNVTDGLSTVFARVDDYSLNDLYGAVTGFNTNYLADLNGSPFYLHTNNDPLGIAVPTVAAAAADNYLFTTDAEGTFFALGEDASGLYANVPLFDTGYNRGISANNPLSRAFRHLHLRLVNRAGYLALKKVNADGTGGLSYDQLASGTYDKPLTKTGTTTDPYAFEWGETAYVAVYGFPYATKDLSNNNIAPPTINVTLTTDAGGAPRNIPVDSRQFYQPLTSPKIEDTDPTTGGDLLEPDGMTAYLQDGYAIVPIAFAAQGTTALPPGGGTISATLTTGALSTSGSSSTVFPDVRTAYNHKVNVNGAVTSVTSNDATIRFVIANPLAIVLDDGTGKQPSSDPALQIGYSTFENATSTGLPENLVNGTPNVAGDTNVYRSQLQASTGNGNHGSTATTRVYVVDRSLMVLLQEDGIGNVRLIRSNLQRQGGLAPNSAIVNPLDPVLYPGFEDRPNRFPNTSLDYPSIGREQIRSSVSADGLTADPVLAGVHLSVPTVDGTNPLNSTNIPANNQRYVKATPLDLSVDIPLYQPPVDLSVMGNGTVQDNPNDLTNVRHNSKGGVLPQGYFGRIQVFIDTNGNGQLATTATTGLGTNPVAGRKPYRSFNLSSAVNPQYSILTNSPTVDLGSVAMGTGLQPGNGNNGNPQKDTANGAGNGLFDPWKAGTPGYWGDLFQPISVRNDGNVNLRNLRVAKGMNQTGNANGTNVWTLPVAPGADLDPLSYLSALLMNGGPVQGSGSLWSNIDATFAAINGRASGATATHVILPKPRVTDRVATELVANAYPRANPNVNASGRPYDLNASGKIINVATLDTTPNTASTALLRVPTSPKVGVSVPLGYPSGNYQAQVQVVEDEFALSGFPNSGLDNEILQFANGYYEAYSPPITVTWKIRESRLTNRSTARTAPMIDDSSTFVNAAVGTYVGTDNKVSHRNSAPAAMRAANGSLLVAWASDRATGAANSAAPNTDRIFLAEAANNASFSPSGYNAPAGNPPLWDLTQFDTSKTSWFQTSGAFPASGAETTLFPGADTATARFTSPAFTSRSNASPYDFASGGTGTIYMAFVGSAQVVTGTGRIPQSKVFLSTVSLGNGTPSVASTVATASDPQTEKGKPAVLSLSATDGAMVFYSETSGGQSGITFDRLRPDGTTFATPVALDFGGGFSSVFSPSVNARLYQRGLASAKPIVELTFAGKLRGRANAEPYIGRLALGTPRTSDPTDAAYGTFVGNDDSGALHLLDAQGRTVEYAKAGTAFALLPPQQNEQLVADSAAGVMRARGVAWNSADFLKRIQDTADFQYSPLVQYLNGGSANDLLVRSTATVDRQSGLIVCDSRLGGRVYIDPELGIVRFVGGLPGTGASVRLTYRPTFLRVTPGGGAAYSAVNGLFDDRYAMTYDANNNVVAPAYWFAGAGTYGAVSNNNTGMGNVGGTVVRSDRYVFAYARGAAGNQLAARPYTTTMRIGLRLPTRMATDQAGNVYSVRVTGAYGPYQVDPANGRVYFEAIDEDNPFIQVTYVAADEATNGLGATITVSGAPSFVLEKTETPVPVDQATNDSAVTAFLDPFTYQGTPRPPLLWLFYVSTRAGGPDLYFQTLAPSFVPASK